MSLKKIALTSRAVALPPGATSRMPIGAQVAQTKPALIRTARLGTKVLGRVNGPGASMGRKHRIGSYRGLWRGMRWGEFPFFRSGFQ